MFRCKASVASVCLVVMVLCGSDAAGQAPRPELGTGLELPKGAPVPVLVEDVDEAARKWGLTREFIQAQVALRLRRNGITPERAEEDLTRRAYVVSVNVGVAGPAFVWSVEFRRVVTYTVQGRTFLRAAKTYQRSGFGIHGSDRTFIMDGVLEDGIDVLSNEILESAL